MSKKQSLLTLLAKLNNKGFSTIEPLIALALFAMIISSVLATAFASQILTTHTENRLVALTLAQTKLEEVKNELESNWFADILLTTQQDIFTITTNIEDTDDYTKQITINTTWSESQNNKNLSIYTIITDWKSASLASPCQTKIKNWANPQIISTTDIGSDNPTTAISIKNNFLYLSTDSATQNKPDFYIYDITDPVIPKLLSSLNTGPGVSSFAIAGDYAYLGNQSINGQLEVIDIKNKSQPILMKTYKLPGVYTDGTTIANTLIYDHGKIFLGTAKSQISELHIIDVTSPLSPKEVGNFEVNAGINALNIKGQNIYIASPASEEIKVVNFANLPSVSQVAGYDAPGGSGNGKALFRKINTLFMGRTLGGKELNSLDVSSINPALLGSEDTQSSINSITGSEDALFLLTTDLNKKIQLWNVESPALPFLAGTINNEAVLTNFACNKNALYVSTTAPNGFIIYKPQN